MVVYSVRDGVCMVVYAVYDGVNDAYDGVSWCDDRAPRSHVRMRHTHVHTHTHGAMFQ